MVKDLREMTGAGMMDCKAALGETSGDVAKAVDLLRKKGLSKAAKKADRVAAEGLVGVAVQGNKGVLVEVNSETDFVARNDLFQGLVKMIANVALDVGADVEKIKAAKTGSHTIAEDISETVAKIGENMTLRRAAALSVGKGAIGSYVRGAVIEGAGKLGVLVGLESTGKADELAELGKQIAMHVAAANPLALNADDLDADLVERERSIAMEKAKESGKPQNIVEKMVEGGLAKFRKDNALLSQLFVMDGKTPVAEVVAQAGKEAGTPVTLAGFVRFQLGEGIEKKQEDFAAEVAAAAGTNKAEPVA
jgi:elongation factor Ts